jgi:hypothetical protein
MCLEAGILHELLEQGLRSLHAPSVVGFGAPDVRRSAMNFSRTGNRALDISVSP